MKGGEWLKVDLRVSSKDDFEECSVLALWMPEPANELTDIEMREPLYVLVLWDNSPITPMVVGVESLTYARP